MANTRIQIAEWRVCARAFLRQVFAVARAGKRPERRADLKLSRGGHDPLKVYNAYAAAVRHSGRPTVILAKTVKGFGLGEAGEGQNINHQLKKVGADPVKAFARPVRP